MTLAYNVIEADHRLVAAAGKASEELARHRWHWTLDESNNESAPASVSTPGLSAGVRPPSASPFAAMRRVLETSLTLTAWPVTSSSQAWARSAPPPMKL